MTDWLIVGWLVLIQVQLWLQGRRIQVHGKFISDIVQGFVVLLRELREGKDAK